MSSTSAGFHADTICLRENGVFLNDSMTLLIWSIVPPSGAAQDRHCFPYTGPRSPFSSAHSSQIVTPRSCNQRTFVEPRRNHRSSTTTDLKCTRLVVIRGKESRRSKRICRPKTPTVPVPVRSWRCAPASKASLFSSRISRSRFS